MTDGRWSAERVLSLATDASSARAARGLARPEVWTGTGASSRALWGQCRGTSPKPYQVAVDLTGPAYRCTCPSRKTPCKHALALLLLWPASTTPPAASTTSAAADGPANPSAASPAGAGADDPPEDEAGSPNRTDGEASPTAETSTTGETSPAGEDGERGAGDRTADERTADERTADERTAGERAAGERTADERTAGERGAAGEGAEPGWVGSWLDERAARADQSAEAGGRGRRSMGRVADPAAARARAERRADRVASGVAELRTWLGDRVRRGLGGFEQNGYSELNRLAARMVDAQAPGLAGALRRAAANVGRGDDWPGRLLEDLAMIHVTAQAHGRLAVLPGPLAESVRTRIGWTTETARVQAEGERVTDDWLVLGRVVELDERLTTRRIWLRGTRTGRTALLLTFAAAGQYLDPSPAAPGEHLTATLAFYPAAHPLRALITPDPPDDPDNPDNPAPATRSAASSGKAADGVADASAGATAAADDAAGRGAAAGAGDPAGGGAGGGAGGVAAGGGVGGGAEVGGVVAGPRGTTVEGALAEFAGVLAVDPWVERVAVVLAGVRPGRNGDGWALVDDGGDGGDGVELSAYADPWPLLAVSAGGPVTVAGEWSRGGLVPMTCWHGGRVVALT